MNGDYKLGNVSETLSSGRVSFSQIHTENINFRRSITFPYDRGLLLPPRECIMKLYVLSVKIRRNGFRKPGVSSFLCTVLFLNVCPERAVTVGGKRPMLGGKVGRHCHLSFIGLRGSSIMALYEEAPRQ